MAFSERTRAGVTYLVSDALLSRHAFATRLGGVSTLPHTASLNLAFGRGDDEATVHANLECYGRAVGFDPRAVVSLPQVHGRTVHSVDARHRGLGYSRRAVWPDARGREMPLTGDGYVTVDPAVVPGVKTADCTPILLEARQGRRVVAVGALHAGWKGTVADIAAAGVQALQEAARAAATGDEPLTLHAAIGPCIHSCCFEVQDDCLSVVYAALGDMAERFIGREAGRRTLDLPGLNRALLLRAGVDEANIDVCPLCTACRTDRFYSHRAMRGVRGTMLHVISL